MKGHNWELIALFLLFYCSALAGQSTCLKVDKVTVVYETFNAHNKEPYSVEEFDSFDAVKVITHEAVIDSILQLYIKVINEGTKRELTRFSPKVLCRAYQGDSEIFRFYYTSFKKFYSNGLFYAEDFGLLQYLESILTTED